MRWAHALAIVVVLSGSALPAAAQTLGDAAVTIFRGGRNPSAAVSTADRMTLMRGAAAVLLDLAPSAAAANVAGAGAGAGALVNMLAPSPRPGEGAAPAR